MFSVILIDYLQCNYDGFSGGTSVYLCTATAIMCHTLFYDCVGVAVRTLLPWPCESGLDREVRLRKLCARTDPGQFPPGLANSCLLILAWSLCNCKSLGVLVLDCCLHWMSESNFSTTEPYNIMQRNWGYPGFSTNKKNTECYAKHIKSCINFIARIRCREI